MVNKGWFGACAVAWFAGIGGCSSMSEEDTVPMSQPFGSASCGTATADVVTTGFTRLFSPSSYDTCFRGYVVDINNLASTEKSIVATWHGPGLTTQTACEDAWGAAIFYKKVGGQWVDQTGTMEASGRWSSGCAYPSIKSPTLTPGQSYRVAATMRNRPWGGSLRSIEIETIKQSSAGGSGPGGGSGGNGGSAP